VAYLFGRRSLVQGLLAVITVGYFYGITRANLNESAAHFIFDAAVIGLYLAQWRTLLRTARQSRLRKLQGWLLLLLLWPSLLLLAPAQHPLVAIVGLRGNIFFLPFVLLGAWLSEENVYRLTLGLAVLNIVAFGFAVAEFFIGVDNFFPYREGVTTIVYMSKDLVGHTAFRIPATFSNAHSYAGTMVLTIPLLGGAWVRQQKRVWQWYLLTAALAVSVVGVFMAGPRTPVVYLFALILVFTLSQYSGLLPRLLLILMMCGVGYVVASDARLQRFTALLNESDVAQRIYGSANETFLEHAVRYPLGNGLGGGGTSLPYFLQSLVKERPLIENEYGRIMLEQGVPGLCLWLAFLAWAFTRRISVKQSQWKLGRQLSFTIVLISFSTAFLGTGTLTSIPGTGLLLLLMGWVLAASPDPLRVNRSARNTESEPVYALTAYEPYQALPRRS
jgi:hypothetical protein